MHIGGDLVATKLDKIEYSGKKKRIAEILINPEYKGTVTEACEEVGVARSTFYKWLKDREYLRYLQEQIDSFTDSELADVWKALIIQCKKGNVKAIKLFFELKGKYSIKIDTPALDKLDSIIAEVKQDAENSINNVHD